MTEFHVSLTTTASTYITVEADDEDAAVDAAYEEVPSICAQCAGWGRKNGIELAGDWDVAEVTPA